MKKGVKNKPFQKRFPKQEPVNKTKSPWWVVDGFVGFLALMIYNFLLYLLDAAGTGGVIGKMQDAVGHFGVKSFLDFGFNAGTISIGILLMFAFSFCLGMAIGNFVRKKRNK